MSNLKGFVCFGGGGVLTGRESENEIDIFFFFRNEAIESDPDDETNEEVYDEGVCGIFVEGIGWGSESRGPVNDVTNIDHIHAVDLETHSYDEEEMNNEIVILVVALYLFSSLARRTFFSFSMNCLAVQETYMTIHPNPALPP